MLRSLQNSGLEFQPQRIPSVSVMGEMTAVEYDEDPRFFSQRVIFGIASISSMFYTSKELDDPPNGRFWTLTPDGDMHPDTFSVPSATGLVWLDGKNQPILTTMMLAGHRFVRVHGFGVQRQIFSRTVTL